MMIVPVKAIYERASAILGALQRQICAMAYFGMISCINCESTLNMQLRNLFLTEDHVYDSVWGLVGITLNFERHWCDAVVLEAVLLPLVDIIDSGERAVVLLAGFIKPFIADSVANVILSLEEAVKVSILKVYFQFDNYLPSETEDDHEEEDSQDSEDSAVDDESVDSDTIQEMARREVWKGERVSD
ncbi:hypothetical protein SUGI_0283510 [Cryptomeria japonica]|nr:hypothetical protein SUGI_0283510 [Cryptomeria japonica]